MQTQYVTLPIVGRVELGAMWPGERNLVLSSWAQGLADAAGHGPTSGSRHRKVYLERFHEMVEDQLSIVGTLVRVARCAEDQVLAYGWCCWSGDTVHWCSTKRAFRRLGMAAALLPEGARHYSRRSRFDAVAERHGLTLRPMPLARRSA